MIGRTALAFVVVLSAFFFYKINQFNGTNTVQIIEQYGYKCEIHHITTEDGYILTYHRIPPSAKTKNKPPVLLMHGLLDSSAVFVQLGRELGLGFILADLGYDVWLGNHRGNGYCRNHTTLDPVLDSAKFYNFSWHEIGYYDIPGAVDYILNSTGHEDLHYVGMSLGGTVFLVAASTRPEYGAKFRLASLMAPAAFFYYYPENFGSYLIHNYYLVDKLFQMLHQYELPFTGISRMVVPPLCSIPVVSAVCLAVFAFNIESIEDAYHNWDYIPTIAANSPSNTATKELIHLSQQIVKGGFSMFDYGPAKNLEIYGNDKPPQYNLTNIVTPVAVYYAKKDKVISFKDQEILISKLTNVANNYLVRSNEFSHSSFVFSKDVVELVYNELVDVIEKS